jgi:hypothetical protein
MEGMNCYGITGCTKYRGISVLLNTLKNMGFEALTAVVMKSYIPENITLH